MWIVVNYPSDKSLLRQCAGQEFGCYGRSTTFADTIFFVNFWSHSFFSHIWSSNAMLIFSSAPHPLVVITLNFIKSGVPYTILSS